MSTRGRFGLRALLHLAENDNDTPVSVSALAREMAVSADYLMQLFVKLRRAGLIKSIRGPRGGFVLSRAPAKITVGDIVRAVEGPIGVAPCIAPEPCYGGRGRRRSKALCPKRDSCAARVVWQQLSAEIEDFLDNTDLRQVLTEAQRLQLRPV
ncbi:MAG TPA: Rrf2 family transcriptional regulator [bacterium]|nr:Rrf2 family transcriptional regulator [bacterium]